MHPLSKNQSGKHKKQQPEAYLNTVYSEQVILPQFSNQLLLSLPKNNSQTIQRIQEQSYGTQIRKKENQNYAKAVEKQIEKKLNTKPSLSKADIIQNNKKQRVTRKNHYRYASELNNYQKFQQNKLNLVLDSKNSKSIKITQKEPTLQRNLFSAYSTRSQQRQLSSNNYLRSVSLNTQRRPATALDKKNEIVSKKGQYLPNNPRVIYPFHTKIKIKRIDENPKILALVLSKKHKTMQKSELYSYINKLINRRPQQM